MSLTLVNRLVLGALALASFTSSEKKGAFVPDGLPPDCGCSSAMMLAQGLDEPMEMGILPNLNVVIVEGKGGVRRSGKTSGAVSRLYGTAPEYFLCHPKAEI